MEKYSRARQATVDIMVHAHCMLDETHTQNMQYLLFFHCNNGCTNMLHCYIRCILPLLSISSSFQVDITVMYLLSLVFLAVLVD